MLNINLDDISWLIHCCKEAATLGAEDGAQNNRKRTGEQLLKCLGVVTYRNRQRRRLINIYSQAYMAVRENLERPRNETT